MTQAGNAPDTTGSPTSTNDALEEIWDDIDQKLSYKESYYKPNGLHTISALGDSLTSSNKNAKYSDINHFPGDPYTGRYSWLDYGITLSGCRIYNRGVCATGGYTIQQIYDIHLPQVLAMKPDFCLVFAGQNDLGNLTDGKLAVLGDMYAKLIRAGITPIPVTPIASNTATGMYKLMNYVYSLAFKYDLKVFDFNQVMQNPATGTVDASLTSDGLHPYTPAAYKALGVAFSNFLKNELLPNVAPQTALLGRHSTDPAFKNLSNSSYFAASSAQGEMSTTASKWDTRLTITKTAPNRTQVNTTDIPVKDSALYRLGMLLGADVEQYSACWAISVYSNPDFALLAYWDWQTADVPIDTLLSTFIKTTPATTSLLVAFEIQTWTWSGTNLNIIGTGGAGAKINVQQLTSREVLAL